MQELLSRRAFGPGIELADVLATRDDPDNPLPLPALAELAPYSIATAERALPGGRVEVRLWMSEADAERYLARRSDEGALYAGQLFSVLPSRIRSLF